MTTTAALALLDSLSAGFRTHYLRYDALQAQLDAWVSAFPQLARLERIGTTPEGRALHVLVIGVEPERRRPSVWVDGNMHATEVCGSSVALAIAEDVLRIHLGGDARGLPAPAAARVREVLFHVLPRLSPDGAEHILTTGAYVRSVNRDARTQQQHPRWIGGDVDGDGLALSMRVRDPAGEFVEAPEHPGLMVPRSLGDEGPFYKLYPEGTIAHFDGAHVPDPYFLSDNKPLRGDLSEWAYTQRGCVAYVVELWDLFAQLGKKKPKRFVDYYTHLTREDLIALARWDAEHNCSRVIRPWTSATHPQLGAVEVGGVDPRVGLSNPPYERLAEVCEKHSAHFLRVAALAPRVQVEQRAVKALGADVAHVEVIVRNDGYLPTFVLSSAKALTWNEPLLCEARGDGALVVEGETRREIGHLDGWGRGLFDGSSALYFQRSRGTSSQRVVRFTTRGKGTLIVRAGSSRTGHVETRIDVG